MKTRMLIAAAVATVALGVNAAYANDGWDLSRMTDTAPRSQVQPAWKPAPAQRPAQVSTATQQNFDRWNWGNG